MISRDVTLYYLKSPVCNNNKKLQDMQRNKVLFIYMEKKQSSKETVPEEAQILDLVERTVISYFRYVQRTKGKHVYRTKGKYENMSYQIKKKSI